MKMEKCEDHSHIDAYKGYAPPAGTVCTIERISPKISPEDFFHNYVAKRKPVILTGQLQDSEWKGSKWTNQYLIDKAGGADVIVEQRGVEKDSAFGLMAPKVCMKYGEFLKNVVDSNDRLYLTTQDLDRFVEDVDDMGMPQCVMAQPLKTLREDFPIRPKLLGNIIPHQLSVWQGIAKEGTSSGLHHDYHDNLYLLVRGRKRFRLFPPNAAQYMSTAGTLAKVHHNGLIVYRNCPEDPVIQVRSDGVPMSFIVRKKKDEAESRMMEAEEALEELDSADCDLTDEEKIIERERFEKIVEECGEQIDEAIAEYLVYGCQNAGESDEDDDLEDSLEEPVPAKRLRTTNSDSGSNNNSDSQTSPSKQCAMSQANFEQRMPDHFCDIKFPLETDDPEQVFKDYPEIKTNVGFIFCEVRAGEMLYLPASWFHEVTSYSSDVATSSDDISADSDKGHLAFNYWMYPPDHDVFDQPYEDDFWPSRWKRVKNLQFQWEDNSESEGETHSDDAL